MVPVNGVDLCVDTVGQRTDPALLRLEGVGHETPPAAVWSQVIDEITARPA